MNFYLFLAIAAVVILPLLWIFREYVISFIKRGKTFKIGDDE